MVTFEDKVNAAKAALDVIASDYGVDADNVLLALLELRDYIETLGEALPERPEL